MKRQWIVEFVDENRKGKAPMELETIALTHEFYRMPESDRIDGDYLRHVIECDKCAKELAAYERYR